MRLRIRSNYDKLLETSQLSLREGAFHHLLVEQNQYSVILCHLDVTLCKQ